MSVAQLAAGRRPALLARAARIGWVTRIAAAWLAILVILAVIGPLVAPHDPNAIDLLSLFANPSTEHLLGTDSTGRDIFSRLVVGVRLTLLGPLLVVVLAVAVGTALAVAAAWFGGWVDTVISRVLDVLFAFPGLVIAMLAVALFGAGLVAPVIALSIAYVPVMARVLRTAAIRERNLPYVAALTVQGAGRLSICLRHIVPNLLPIITVQAVVGFSYALLDLAAISYLGLGLQPPAADWGLMVSAGQSAILSGHPLQSIVAAALIVVTVLATNLLGDALAARFESGTSR
jgi:peptide/nickel transport system permease protein